MKKVNFLPSDDNQCGWFHLSDQRQATPSHTGTTSTRWTVVGAGLTGLAAARRLAEHFPDDEIILLEAQEVGYGSSGRNSGFAIDLPHNIGASDYIGDPTQAGMQLKLNLKAQNSIKQLVEQHHIECQLSTAGKYQAAVEPRGLSVLKAYQQGLDKLEQDYQLISESELPDHLGTRFYKKALYTPGTLLLQPAALVKGLANALPKNVSLYENTPVSSVEYGKKITLHHLHGQIVTDQLLLTNNAFASHFGFLPRKILPIFTYASLTRVLSADEQHDLGGLPHWGVIPADPFGSTLRRTPDNRILVRNSLSFNPSGQHNPSFLRKALKRHRLSFENRFPMLSQVDFEYTWGGAMGLTRNHQGHFGPLATNVHAAVGCNGLGITRGTSTGTLLADWIAGDHNELIDFLLTSSGPSANPPEPLLSLGINFSLHRGQHRAGKEC